MPEPVGTTSTDALAHAERYHADFLEGDEGVGQSDGGEQLLQLADHRGVQHTGVVLQLDRLVLLLHATARLAVVAPGQLLADG